MELHKGRNPREQSRHSDWNFDRGSRNQIPGGWQSAGDYGADRDEYGGGVGGLVNAEEIEEFLLSSTEVTDLSFSRQLRD